MEEGRIFGIVSAYMSATISPWWGPLVLFARLCKRCVSKGEKSAELTPLNPFYHLVGMTGAGSHAFNVCMNGTSDGISGLQDGLTGEREMFYYLKIP